MALENFYFRVLKLNIDFIYTYKCRLCVSAPGEKDMILMHHSIGVTWPDNSQENRVINFVCYGEENGYSAMARTVGMPTAIATKLILDGTIVYDITNFGSLALFLEFCNYLKD